MSLPASQFIAALGAALLLAHVSYAAEEVALPRYIKTCKRDTPDYSSCLRLALQEAWPYAIKGIPELDLPPFDPLFIEFIEHSFQAGDINGRFVFRNFTVYGLAKTKFLAVRPSFEDNHVNMEIDFEVPRIYIEGYYKADGAIGFYRTGGKGYFNVSMEGLSSTARMEGSIVDDRLVVEHMHVYPEIESVKVYFTDMFNGDEALNKAALTFVNQYWQVIHKAMMPYTEKESDERMTSYLNEKIFSKLSAAKIFP